jgi:hypothetical protein
MEKGGHTTKAMELFWALKRDAKQEAEPHGGISCNTPLNIPEETILLSFLPSRRCGTVSDYTSCLLRMRECARMSYVSSLLCVRS